MSDVGFFSGIAGGGRVGVLLVIGVIHLLSNDMCYLICLKMHFFFQFTRKEKKRKEKEYQRKMRFGPISQFSPTFNLALIRVMHKCDQHFLVRIKLILMLELTIHLY